MPRITHYFGELISLSKMLNSKSVCAVLTTLWVVVVQGGGRQLHEAVQQNKTITHMDLRLSECGHEAEYCINQILVKNRERRRGRYDHCNNGRTDDTKLG